MDEIKQGDRLALEKGWWKTGERKGIQLKHSIQIWRSMAVNSDWELKEEVEEDDIDRDIELEDQIAKEAQEREQEEPDEEEEKAEHKTEAEKEYGQEWAPWR